MLIDFDEKSDVCYFTECRCNENNTCRGDAERDFCVDMALKTLGVDRVEITKECDR